MKANKEHVDDEIKQLRKEVGTGGMVDDLAEQIKQLEKQSKKYGLDMASKSYSIKNSAKKISKDQKLINKVLKEEKTHDVMLAVGRKNLKSMLVDIKNAAIIMSERRPRVKAGEDIISYIEKKKEEKEWKNRYGETEKDQGI